MTSTRMRPSVRTPSKGRTGAKTDSSHTPPGGDGDGRALRRERNHQLIVEACYALIRSGVIEPTADDVALRAGLGRRTVFRQFQDMEALNRSVNERVAREIAPLAGPLVPTGGLETDLRMLVERRTKLFEHIAPFRRAGALTRHRSEFLRAQNAVFAAMQRARVEAVVGPHIESGREHLLEAIDLLLSFEGWQRLREDQQLAPERVVEVMWRAALKLAVP